MNNRIHTPASLERELMIESGYRCAVCKTPSPLEIDHIIEYSIVKENSFENMIVLCSNCHSRKSSGNDPREINRISLKKIKDNLMMLNGRYTDLEKRLLSEFKKSLDANPNSMPYLDINITNYIFFKYLIDDGYLNYHVLKSGIMISDSDENSLNHDQIRLFLSESGKEFLLKLSM